MDVASDAHSSRALARANPLRDGDAPGPLSRPPLRRLSLRGRRSLVRRMVPVRAAWVSTADVAAMGAQPVERAPDPIHQARNLASLPDRWMEPDHQPRRQL